MFYVYMVFADILAQQTTNVKQNQVLGITETKSRLAGRGFMLCPAEKSFDSGKLACDNKANANCNIKLSISSVRISQVTARCGLGEEGAVGDRRGQAGRAGQAA